MWRTGVLALSLVMAGAAASFAQTADVPVPPQGSDPSAWFESYIKADGWTVLGADGVAFALGGPDGVTQLQDGTLRATVRHEYYQQRTLGGHPMRSSLQTRFIDCHRGRNRIVSFTIFEHSNMQGAAVTQQNPNAAWSEPGGDSLYGVALERICAAPSEGVRQR